MKRNLFLILLLAGFCACSESSLIKKIPADAEFVVFADFRKLALQSIDPGMLFSSDEITKGQESQEIWKNSGIDFLAEAVIFSKTDVHQENLWFLLLPLAKPEEFRIFCEKYGAKKDQETGQGWYIKGNQRFLIQDKIAVGVFSEGAVQPADLKKEVLAILNLKEENNLLSVSNGFRLLEEEGKPLGIWANLDQSFSGFSLFLPSEILIGEATGSVDFKSGELAFDARLFMEDSLKKTSFLGNPIQAKLLKNITSRSGNAGFLALSLSLQPIYKMLESLGYSSSGSIMAAQYGISLEEILQTLSGELVISGSQAKDNNSEMPELLVLLGLQKPADSLLDELHETGVLMPSGSGKFSIIGFPGINLLKKENSLEIVTDGFRPAEITDNKLEDFATDAPAQVLCSVNLVHLNDALSDNRFAAGASTVGKYWKNFRLRVSQEESGNSLLNCRLECLKEDDNSLLVLLKSLNEISRESGKDKNQAGNRTPVF